MYVRDSIHHRYSKNNARSLKLIRLKARAKVNTKGNGRRSVKSRKLGKGVLKGHRGQKNTKTGGS